MSLNISLINQESKELPNNIPAEQAIIGTILLSNEIFDEILLFQVLISTILCIKKSFQP